MLRSSCPLGAALLWGLGGCQASASSPPEPLPPAQSDAAPARACLAQTHPILGQSISSPRSQLFALDAASGDSVAIYSGEFAYGAVWSPNGRSIAFRRRALAAAPLVPTELGLSSPDTDGEEVVLLVDSAPPFDGISQRNSDGPSWSPDGRQLAFASLRESDHSRIWVIARSGGQLRLLFPELERVPHFYPSWSPQDASRLAYVAETNGVLDLWWADLGSGEHHRLTMGQMEQFEAPRWSPDGERLAFSALPRERPAEQGIRPDIYVASVASGELTQVTLNAGGNTAPVWSPDGSSLLVGSTRGSTPGAPVQPMNVWHVWLDGSRPPEQLTRSRSSTTPADWYPLASCDGSRQ